MREIDSRLRSSCRTVTPAFLRSLRKFPARIILYSDSSGSGGGPRYSSLILCASSILHKAQIQGTSFDTSSRALRDEGVRVRPASLLHATIPCYMYGPVPSPSSGAWVAYSFPSCITFADDVFLCFSTELTRFHFIPRTCDSLPSSTRRHPLRRLP